MEAEQKRSLLSKIDSLTPEQQDRVVGYVDALLQNQNARGDGGNEQSPEPHGNKNVSEEEDEEVPTSESEQEINLQELRGTLSHLKEVYTAEELKEKANEWRMKEAMDY